MNTIIGFPKPQVACSIHAGGATIENIENWIESWVSELEEAVEIFFGP